MDKVVESFDKAVKDIDDGSTCMMFCWISTGTPCNLIRALYNTGKIVFQDDAQALLDNEQVKQAYLGI